MATFNSPLYASQAADRANTSRLPAPNQAGGGIQYATIPYALAGTEAADGIINLCKLPVGAILVPGASWIDLEDPGTTLTAHIGTAEDPDCIANGLTLSAGGHILATSGTMPAAALTPTAIQSTDIFATVATATSLTAGAKLCFNIGYKLNA